MLFSQTVDLKKSRILNGFICVGLGLVASGCANNSSQSSSAKSSEIGAFPQAKYGQASERVIANGEPVPKGGGRYQVGKPYSVAGRTYVPREMNGQYSAVGMASWYGDAFHGRRTANGEVYDKNSFTAAHPTMPLPSYARVTNVSNGHSMIVRVNDRGPYHGGRVMDVSERVASALEFKGAGTARLRIEHLGPAGLAGSDDKKLLASLNTSNQPALLPETQQQVQVASNDSRYVPPSSSYVPATARYVAPVESTSSSNTAVSNAVLSGSNTGSRLQSASGLPVQAIPKPIISAEEQAAIETDKESLPEVSALRGSEPAELEANSSTSSGAVSNQPLKTFIPLPPQRPYNFASISAPVKTQTGRQTATLASFFAEPEAGRTVFSKNDPFVNIVDDSSKSVYIAVGVFKNEMNAKRLASELGKAAHIQITELSDAKGLSYKVTAGPVTSLDAVDIKAQSVSLGAKDARILNR